MPTTDRDQAWLDETSIRSFLIERVAERCGVTPEAVDPDRPLAELGLASRDTLAITGQLEELVDRPLPTTLVYEHPTITALARALGRPAHDPPVHGRPAHNGPEHDRPALDRPVLPAGATSASPSAEPIAVVGLGCRFPGGVDGPEAYWRFLLDGGDAIGEVPEGRWEAFESESVRPGAATRLGGFLSDVAGFDSRFFGITPGEADAMDPQQRLLLEVVWEAFEHAGIAPASLRGSRTGVFVGVSSPEYTMLTATDPARLSLWTATGAALSIVANRVSYLLDLRGPSLSVDTACSSSLVAVHLAVRSLRAGESDLAVAGGVNVLLSPMITMTFDLAGGTAPDGRCKAFDASANGMVRAEGCGVVVLKRLGDAQRDGDRVLAVVQNTAVNSDGRSNGLVAPNLEAQKALLREAYAGLEPPDYVEAHGTGTLLGDPIEAQALGSVLGRGRVEPLLIGSVKTNLGHLEPAAGAAGIIKTVLALAHRTIPASLHYHRPNPHIDFDGLAVKVVTEQTPWPSGPGLAGVSSFGFGGTNAHVVLAEAPPPPPRTRTDFAPHVVSATSEAHRDATPHGALTRTDSETHTTPTPTRSDSAAGTAPSPTPAQTGSRSSEDVGLRAPAHTLLLSDVSAGRIAEYAGRLADHLAASNLPRESWSPDESGSVGDSDGSGAQGDPGDPAGLGAQADPGDPGDLVEVAHTLARRFGRGRHGAAVVGRDRAALVAGLRALHSGDADPRRPDAGPAGHLVITGTATGATAPVWVFSGYGAQRPGMARRLLTDEPSFADAVEELEPLIQIEAGFSLREALERQPALPSRPPPRRPETGPETDPAQTMVVLFAVQVGLSRLWQSYGVAPAAVIGHSMGEVAAAVTAGALSLADGVKVISSRADLLTGIVHRGAMAVIGASGDETAELSMDCPDVHLAARLSPRQVVVTGDADQIATVVLRASARGLLARVVRAEGAGHSPQVEPLMEPLRNRLAGIRPTVPTVPFYSTALDDPRRDATFDANYWAANLRNCVRLAEAVSAAAQDGHRTFVEISAHPLLIPSLTETVQDALVLPTLRRAPVKGVEADDTVTFHAQLAALKLGGLPVGGPAPARIVDLPRPSWRHERHWTSTRRATRPDEHPLLGAHVELPGETPGERRHAWSANVGLEPLPWLPVHGVTVLPAAAYAEIALAAGTEALGMDTSTNTATATGSGSATTTDITTASGSGTVILTDLRIERFLPLDEHTTIVVTCVIVSHGSRARGGRVEVRARTEAGTWTLVACATVSSVSTVAPTGETGEKYRGRRLAVLTPASGSHSGFRLHPVVLDRCLASFGVQWTAMAIGSVRVLGPTHEGGFCEFSSPRQEDDETAVAALRLVDKAGNVLLEADDIVLRRVPRTAVPVPLAAKLVETIWSETPQSATAHRSIVQGSIGQSSIGQSSIGQSSIGQTDTPQRDTHGNGITHNGATHNGASGSDTARSTIPSGTRRNGANGHDTGVGTSAPVAADSTSWTVLSDPGDADARAVIEGLVAAGERVTERHGISREGLRGTMQWQPQQLQELGETTPQDPKQVPEPRQIPKPPEPQQLRELPGTTPWEVREPYQARAGLVDVVVMVPSGLGDEDLVLSLSRVVRALPDEGRLWIVTRRAVAALDGEAGVPRQGFLPALTRVLGFEHPGLRPTFVDSDGPAAVVAELLGGRTGTEVAWRDGVRYEARLRPVRLGARRPLDVVRRGGAYVISGGYGGLGLVTARRLAERGAGRLVLSGRSGPGAEGEKVINSLRASGTEVEIVLGDVAAPGVAERMVAAACRDGLRLCGVVHAAGGLDDRLAVDIGPGDLRRVWSPKVEGAMRLHEATRHLDLDWWVVYSSAAGLLGSPGQAAYASANARVDALVAWRRAHGLPATTINWGTWAEVGGAADLTVAALDPITPEEGADAFEALLAHDRIATGVLRFDVGRAVIAFPQIRDRAYFSELVGAVPTDAPDADHDWAGPDSLRAADPDNALRLLSAQVRARVSGVLGFAPDPEQPLTEVGLDSLVAIRIKSALEHDFGVTVPTPILLGGASVTRLESELRDRLGLRERHADDAGARRIVVPLTEGGRRYPSGAPGLRPFFCAHPAGGSGGVYRQLAALLGEDLAFFGLERFEDSPSVEERAARYVEAIRATQPAGPYRLGGWSFGGVLAYEIARQLGAAAVELVAMIDGGLPKRVQNLTETTARRYADFGRYLTRTYGVPVALPFEELVTLAEDEQLALVMERTRPVMDRLPPAAVVHQFTSHADTRSLERYVPGPYDGHVVLYRSTEPTPWTVHDSRYDLDEANGFAELCSRLEIVPVPGTHHLNLLDPPGVEIIADDLRDRLRGGTNGVPSARPPHPAELRAEPHPAEVHPAEVHPAEVHPAEPHPAEIRPVEPHSTELSQKEWI